MAHTSISQLPDELLEQVLSHVSPYGDLVSCESVCSRWADVVASLRDKQARDFGRAVADRSLVWTADLQDESSNNAISKRYSHSCVYADRYFSMFVFGGCTSTSTTFNDLWRLDLTTRTWERPITAGTYPSPKACAAMVLHPNEQSLLLFGGWTHPSIYPLYQSWRLFNELHVYDIEESRWSQIVPNDGIKPPAMAGHSATIHNNLMVVVGGLHKQRNSIGQFSSSNDVWCFDLKSNCWNQRDIPEPRPTPRYGQSQLYLDEKHLLILGGCGGPNNIFNDVWLLVMDAPHWRWHHCHIRNPDHGTGHMWCNQACKVDNFAVILGKSRLPSASTPASKTPASQPSQMWHVIPQLQRGVNRGHGSIRRPHRAEANHDNVAVAGAGRRVSESSDSSEMDLSQMSADELDIAVEPVDEASSRAGTSQTFKTSVTLNVSPQPARASPDGGDRRMSVDPDLDDGGEAGRPWAPYPSTSSGISYLPRQYSLRDSHSPVDEPPAGAQLPRQAVSLDCAAPSSPRAAQPTRQVSLPRIQETGSPRMQAFAVSPGSLPAAQSTSGNLGAIPKARSKQQEMRQKQLETLRKMEDRIRAMSKSGPTDAAGQQQSSSRGSGPRDARPRRTANSCACHRLSVHVLDISEAIDKQVVTWLDLKSNSSLEAPEETILYSLVRGRNELVLFGGIQKDVSTIAAGTPQSTGVDTVSNSVFYLSPPSS